MALVCRDITLQYQVSILNNGPNLATNVVSTLFLPAEFAQQGSPAVSAGTFTPGTGTWTLPTLDPGKAATLTFTGTLPGSASGHMLRQNALIRSSGQVDPNLGNNAAGTELTAIGPLPVAPVATSVTICTGNDTTLTANGPETLRWYNAATEGSLLGLGATFDTGKLTATTTYYVESFNGCLASNRTPVTVTVNQPIGNNTIAGTQTICQGKALATLTGSTPTGGNSSYNYQWQISTDNENWQDLFPDVRQNGTRGRQKDLAPGALSGTSYFRRRVIAGPCAYSYSNVVTVTVNPLPGVSFTGLPARVCTDVAPITLTGNPAGGTFSGPGISGNLFNPAAAGTGAHSISYTFTNGNQCSNTTSALVLVGLVVYTGASQSACVNAPAFVLNDVRPTGGTWSGPGVSPDGTFNPATAGVGTHVLTYSVTGNFGCGNDPQTVSTTKTIQVSPLPVALAGPNQTTCIEAPDFPLTGFSPANGTWSGPGVTEEGYFRPRVAGLGTHTLTYTPAGNNCGITASKTITVSAPGAVTLAAFTPQCSSTFTPIALTGGSPAGGTYSGPGVLNNRFTPSAAGVGTHTITYTYKDPNGCAVSTSRPVTVEICTGVAEQEILKTLACYPNPAQQQLTLAFRLPAPGPLAVKLLNVAGQVVISQEKARQTGLYEQVFAVGHLPRGVYVLQIITDQALVSKRIILD
jgi:hypothetical protein